MDEEFKRHVAALLQIIEALPEEARMEVLRAYPWHCGERDGSCAAARLNARLEKGDLGGFLAALRAEVKSHGGMDRLAEETEVSRSVAYAATRNSESLTNPKIETVWNILEWLGLEFAVRTKS